jgi:hypothetical protein
MTVVTELAKEANARHCIRNRRIWVCCVFVLATLTVIQWPLWFIWTIWLVQAAASGSLLFACWRWEQVLDEQRHYDEMHFEDYEPRHNFTVKKPGPYDWEREGLG